MAWGHPSTWHLQPGAASANPLWVEGCCPSTEGRRQHLPLHCCEELFAGGSSGSRAVSHLPGDSHGVLGWGPDKSSSSGCDRAASTGTAGAGWAWLPWRRRKMGWCLTLLLAFFFTFLKYCWFLKSPEISWLNTKIGVRGPTAARRKTRL